jgi:DNA polymerase sigma
MAKKKQKSKKDCDIKPNHVPSKQSYRSEQLKSLRLFNVHTMSTRQQSINDKLQFLKANGISGPRAQQIAKCRRKIAQVVRQTKAGKKRSNNTTYKCKKWDQGVQLPSVIPSNDKVPWSLSPSEPSKKSATPPSDRILPFSWYALPQSIVEFFDNELKSFSEYVKLTPHEIASRYSVVEYIRNLCHKLWHDQVVIQQFGSFASPNVCTFQSDVDLAIWNVVQPKEDDTSSCSSSSSDEEKYIFSEASGVVMSQNSLFRTMEALKNKESSKDSMLSVDNKREKVEKWKNALEEVELTSKTSTDEKSNDACDEAKEKEGHVDLFLIDRNPVQNSQVKNTAMSNCIEKTDESMKNMKSEEGTDSDKHVDSSDDDDDKVDKNELFSTTAVYRWIRLTSVSMNTSHEDVKIKICASDDSTDIDGDDNGVANTESKTCSGDDDDDNSSCYKKCSENGDNDRFDLHISEHTNFTSSSLSRSQKFGPTGRTKVKVVKALSLLAKQLWKSSFAQNLHVRKNARVPIICMTTRFGFDSDLALGGHNGMDTSQYVKKLIQKYDSFATVVLFLKILLQQTSLDKPFTGGLGSYKLYVLVANHVSINNYFSSHVIYVISHFTHLTASSSIPTNYLEVESQLPKCY